MPRIKTLTLAMAAVAMATGCASSQLPLGGNKLKIEAVQSVTHGQNNPQAFYQLGRYYHGQTRYDLALESYRQALSLQPQYVDALTGMGVAHATLGQYDEALLVFRAAASLDPGSVYAQNNLGYIYWLRNERDEALRAYRQALRLDPMNARTRENLRLAMKDAANGPVETATIRQPEPSMQTAGMESSSLALKAIAPQVYELQLPAKKETPAQPVVSAALAMPGSNQPTVSNSHTAPVAAASVKPVAASEIALEQVAPRVYELRTPALTAEIFTQAPALLTIADTPAQQSASARLSVPTAVDASIKLEVLNANGVNGMANKVSRYLAARGYPSAGIGNYQHFNAVRTRIEYQANHVEEARRLGTLLPGEVVLTEVASVAGRTEIRLVLGNDIRLAPSAWNYAEKINPQDAAPEGMARAMNDLPLEVANGNGVKGIARKVAYQLDKLGYRTASVYDLRPFNKVMTRIEYPKGHASQALKLGDLLPRTVAYVETGKLRNDMRIVLGHDIVQNARAWSLWLETYRVAESQAAPRI